MRLILRKIRRAAHILYFPHGDAAVEQRGDAAQRVLAHPVAEQVGARIDEDRAADAVLPVIVMREPAGGSLDAADDNRHVAVRFADAVAVDDHGAVGTPARPAAGGIPVVAASLLSGGIMRDHRIDVARVDEEAQPRAAERLERRAAFPVGLRENRYAEARRLKNAGDDRRAERGVIDVRVAGDEYEIGRVPAAGAHVRGAYRQKGHKASSFQRKSKAAADCFPRPPCCAAR